MSASHTQAPVRHMRCAFAARPTGDAQAIRVADLADLGAINRVVERAVMSWDLPERVKRLSLPSLLYQPSDLDSLSILVAEEATVGILGVAALQPADTRSTPEGQSALLLHGIYVLPQVHGAGFGTRLLDASLGSARRAGCQGLLVKAQPGASGFFLACGMEQLGIDDPERDYAYRFWKKVGE